MRDPVYRFYTEEEYLNWESEQNVRLEYIDGFIWAEKGRSIAHNKIATNILWALGPLAKRRDGQAYIANLKVRIPGERSNRYYLPDVVVVFESNLEEHDVETTPCLVVEILDTNSRQVDLLYKRSDYCRLSSVQGYLTVESEWQEVLFHRRTEQGWQIDTVEQSVDLPCLGASLSVAEIYDGVDVPKKD